MKYAESKLGRVFVIRLEDGDVLHECIERFAREKGIRAAALIAVGGADAGSRLVVGPAESRPATPIEPLELALGDACEVAGTGTLFPDEDGAPMIHMHVAAGRGDRTITGCVRRGVKVWHVLEIILIELTDNRSVRKLAPELGFKLLVP